MTAQGTKVSLTPPDAAVPGRPAPLRRCTVCVNDPPRIVGHGANACWWCLEAIAAQARALTQVERETP